MAQDTAQQAPTAPATPARALLATAVTPMPAGGPSLGSEKPIIVAHPARVSHWSFDPVGSVTPLIP
ncbi:hypothetical protein ACIHCX_36355 [Streptomyces sp. NPDC052043]|uniref:hypothetical protein n=1 Tax=Streptomyces sp. NPDC052043 TaxID=3365684 RepID=UPI0037CD3FEE